MEVTPKHILEPKELDWDDLNNTLQAVRHIGDTIIIKLSDYPSLTVSEIKLEAEKNGYVVSDNDDGSLLCN